MSFFVNSKALKRNAPVVHVTYLKESGKDARKLYFSTDLSMDPQDVLLYYHSRFQFNASLTSINIAKAIHWLSIPKEQRGVLTSLSSQARFSMADIKTMNHNVLMLNRFFDVFGINPYSTKNQNSVKEFILYGTMAA